MNFWKEGLVMMPPSERSLTRNASPMSVNNLSGGVNNSALCSLMKKLWTAKAKWVDFPLCENQCANGCSALPNMRNAYSMTSIQLSGATRLKRCSEIGLDAVKVRKSSFELKKSTIRNCILLLLLKFSQRDRTRFLVQPIWFFPQNIRSWMI